MAPPKSRRKPYQLSWPPNPYQWSAVDQMLQQLYNDLNRGAVGSISIDLSQLNLADLTDGDLLYADGDTLSPLAAVASGQVLLSQGLATAPAWGQVDLTVHVTGVLPAANGGTGQSSYTIGDLLYADGATSLAKLAGVATGNVLLSGGVGTAPSWGKVQLAAAGSAVTGILPAANGGTHVGTTATGALLRGTGATTWSTLGITATAGAYLRSSGTTFTWSTLSLPNTMTANHIPYASASNTIGTSSGFTFDGTTLTIPGQIAFPSSQAASSGSNTLDDYEEGDWTPVLGGSGGTSGQSYTIQVGKYVKVGQLVIASGYFTLSAKGTITTSVIITGLPFTSDTTTNAHHGSPIGVFSNMNTSFASIGGIVTENATIAVLFAVAAGGAVSGAAMTTSDITDTTSMQFTFVYRASA